MSNVADEDDRDDGAVDDQDLLEDAFAEEARMAVEEAITKAAIDDVRGVIRFVADPVTEFDVECKSFDKVCEHLKRVFMVAWEGDPDVGDDYRPSYTLNEVDEVETMLSKTGFKDFFLAIREPKGVDKIVSSSELVTTAAQSKLIQRQFGSVSAELIEYFAKHPGMLRTIDPDDFEKLMAAIFRNQGFDVTKTPHSKDGGFDLVLVRHSAVGAAMTLVDCKRYAKTHKVGVEIVRGLYGVVEERKASSGMIVTTSFFTKGAVEFRNQLEYRMALADFERIKDFLHQWKR